MKSKSTKKTVQAPTFNVGDIVEFKIVTDIDRGGHMTTETGVCRILLIERDGIVVRKSNGEGLQIVHERELRPFNF